MACSPLVLYLRVDNDEYEGGNGGGTEQERAILPDFS
jgi:hypothetical protein